MGTRFGKHAERVEMLIIRERLKDRAVARSGTVAAPKIPPRDEMLDAPLLQLHGCVLTLSCYDGCTKLSTLSLQRMAAAYGKGLQLRRAPGPVRPTGYPRSLRAARAHNARRHHWCRNQISARTPPYECSDSKPSCLTIA